METLPVEIVDNVLDMIQGNNNNNLAPYSWMSYNWMKAVEARTFSDLTVYSDDFSSFRKSCGSNANGQARRSLVKKITLQVILPNYPTYVQRRREPQKVAKMNSVIFSRAIKTFYREMAAWDSNGSQNLTMSYDVFSRSDIHRSFRSDIYRSVTFRRDGSKTRRWGHWLHKRVDPEGFLELPIHFDLPSVAAVTTFETHRSARCVHPTSEIQMLAALPGVKTAGLRLSVVENQYKNLHRNYRYELGRSISRLNLHSLTELCISYPAPASFTAIGNIGPVCDTEDPRADLFCQGINRLCQLAPVRKLCLGRGFLLSPVLFSAPQGHDALWPHMEVVHIPRARTLTAEGAWLIRGDGIEGIEPRFVSYSPDRLRRLENGEVRRQPLRYYIDGQSFDPLLQSILQGITKMPKLQNMWVSFHRVLPIVEYHSKTPTASRKHFQEGSRGEYDDGESIEEGRDDRDADSDIENSFEGLPSLRLHRYQEYHYRSGAKIYDSWEVPEDVLAGFQNWMDKRDGVFRETHPKKPTFSWGAMRDDRSRDWF